MTTIKRFAVVLPLLLLAACDRGVEPETPVTSIGPSMPDGFLLAAVPYAGSEIAVRAANMNWDAVAHTATLDIYLVNNGDSPVGEPVNLVVTDIDPDDAMLTNSDGTTTDGKPYRTFDGVFGDDGTLSPGEASASVQHIFDVGPNGSFSVTFRIDDMHTGGSISGTVYADANTNGQRDDGESGVEGVTVALAGTNPTFAAIMTTTDGDGAYAFHGLVADAYTVTVQPGEGVEPTTPGEVLVVLVEKDDGVGSKDGVDFGLDVPPSGPALDFAYDFDSGQLPPWRDYSSVCTMVPIDQTLQLSYPEGPGWCAHTFANDLAISPLTRGSIEFSVSVHTAPAGVTTDCHYPGDAYNHTQGVNFQFYGGGRLIVRTPDFHETGYTYELDKWYRVRVLFDRARGSKGQYDLYVTDIDAGTPETHVGTFDFYSPVGRVPDVYQYGFTGGNSLFYLDDVAVHIE